MESSFDSPWDDCHVSVRKLTSLRLVRESPVPLLVPEVERDVRRPRSSQARALIVAGDSVRREMRDGSRRDFLDWIEDSDPATLFVLACRRACVPGK